MPPLVRLTFLSVIAFAFAMCAMFSCNGDPRQTVVLYVSADEHVARQVIDAFEQQSNVRVLMVGDTEAKKTTGLVNRLRAEKDKPQADVLWSSEVFMTVELADEEILQPIEPKSAQDWPKQFRDPQNRWFGFAARARVVVYAPDRVPADAIPRTWMDLTQSRFRNRIVIADPRFGTTGGHLASMLVYWDREVMRGFYAAFLEGLAENGIRLLPSGNAGVVEAVARGEADVGLTDTDDVWAAKERGLKVEMVYARHHGDVDEKGGGTLVIPNTVAMIKGAPHADAARQLIEFLLSEPVERMLAESVSHNIPVRPKLAEEFQQYAVADPLHVDYRLVAKSRPTAIRLAMRTLTGESTQTNDPKDTDSSNASDDDHAR